MVMMVLLGGFVNAVQTTMYALAANIIRLRSVEPVLEPLLPLAGLETQWLVTSDLLQSTEAPLPISVRLR